MVNQAWLPIDGVSRRVFSPAAVAALTPRARLPERVGHWEWEDDAKKPRWSKVPRVWRQGLWAWALCPLSDSDVVWPLACPTDREQWSLTAEAVLEAIDEPAQADTIHARVLQSYGSLSIRRMHVALSRLRLAGAVVRIRGGESPEYVRAGSIYTRNGYQPDGGMWCLSRRPRSGSRPVSRAS